jgi:hypothetical protein
VHKVRSFLGSYIRNVDIYNLSVMLAVQRDRRNGERAPRTRRYAREARGGASEGAKVG